MVCSEAFTFHRVRGILLREAKAAFRRHKARLKTLQVAMRQMQRHQSEFDAFRTTGLVPGWCKAKRVLAPTLAPMQCTMRELQVPDVTEAGQPSKRLADVLAATSPWLPQLIDMQPLAQEHTAAEFFDSLGGAWERLHLTAKLCMAAEMQQRARREFTVDTMQAELHDELSKLIASTSELTGQPIAELTPKYAAERSELSMFCRVVQKRLTAQAASERKHEAETRAKQEQKERAARDKVDAMGVNSVMAAAVTQTMLDVLPKCGLRVPKAARAAAAQRVIDQGDPMSSAMRERLQSALVAPQQQRQGAARRATPKPKPKSKPQPKARGNVVVGARIGKGKGKAVKTPSGNQRRGNKGAGKPSSRRGNNPSGGKGEAARRVKTATPGKGLGKGKSGNRSRGKGSGSRGKGKGGKGNGPRFGGKGPGNV